MHNFLSFGHGQGKEKKLKRRYSTPHGEDLPVSWNYKPLLWRHNGRDCVSNHQPHDCLLNRLFRRRSKKTSKLRVTGLCVGIHRGPVNSPHKWPVSRKMFPFDDVFMNTVNSLTPGRCNCIVRIIIFKPIVENDNLCICCEIDLNWMPQDSDRPTLFRVMSSIRQNANTAITGVNVDHFLCSHTLIARFVGAT